MGYGHTDRYTHKKFEKKETAHIKFTILIFWLFLVRDFVKKVDFSWYYKDKNTKYTKTCLFENKTKKLYLFHEEINIFSFKNVIAGSFLC